MCQLHAFGMRGSMWGEMCYCWDLHHVLTQWPTWLVCFWQCSFCVNKLVYFRIH